MSRMITEHNMTFDDALRLPSPHGQLQTCPMHSKVWFCGQYIEGGKDHIQGVFTSQAKAEDACRDET